MGCGKIPLFLTKSLVEAADPTLQPAGLLFWKIALLAELQQCNPRGLKWQVLLLAFVVSHFKNLLALILKAMGSSAFAPHGSVCVCVYT